MKYFRAFLCRAGIHKKSSNEFLVTVMQLSHCRMIHSYYYCEHCKKPLEYT